MDNDIVFSIPGFDEVPESWGSVFLNDIAEIIMGQSPDSATYNENRSGIPFFQGKTDFGDIYPTPRMFCYEPTKIAEANDILLSVRAPVGPTNIALEKSCIGRGLSAIRSREKIKNDFLFFWFKAIEPWLSKQGTGTTFKAISGDFIRSLPIPLPPLPEQERIAARLDLLLGKLKSARGRFDALPQIIARFRKSVLAEAVSGRLTEEWREERGLLEWNDFEIGKIVKILNGRAFPSERYTDTGIKLLRPGNLSSSGIVTWTSENTRCLPAQYGTDYPEYILKKNDLVMNLTAQSLKDEFLGRVCLYKDDDHALLNQRICVFYPDKRYVSNEYLWVFFRSNLFRTYVDTLDSGTLIKHMHTKQLVSLSIPLPSLHEQAEIVRRVDALFAKADALEAKVKAARALADRLEPSILAKAFRGELSEQIPEEAAEWERTLAEIEAQAAGLAEKPGAKRGRAAKGAAKATSAKPKELGIAAEAKMGYDVSPPKKRGRPRKTNSNT
jgi:type I restriction enzyme S subunit